MEYIYKCNTCGKIWTFSDADLKADAQNATLGAISAIGQMASVLGGGTVLHTKVLQDQTNNLMNKVVNRDRCPHCNSMYISQITREQLLKEQMDDNTNKTESSGVKESIQINANASIDSLLKRTNLFLEDGDWSKADAYAEACLDMDPTNGKAYLYKLMISLKVQSLDALKKYKGNLKEAPYYEKVIRFGTEDTIALFEELNKAAEEAEFEERKKKEEKCEAIRQIVKQKKADAKIAKEKELNDIKTKISNIERIIKKQDTIIEENKGKLFGSGAKARKDAQTKKEEHLGYLKNLKEQLEKCQNKKDLFEKFGIDAENDMTEEEFNCVENIARIEKLAKLETPEEYPLKAVFEQKEFLWSDRPTLQYGRLNLYLSESKVLIQQYVEDRVWETVFNSKGIIQLFSNASQNIHEEISFIKNSDLSVSYSEKESVLLINSIDYMEMISIADEKTVQKIALEVIESSAGKSKIKYI